MVDAMNRKSFIALLRVIIRMIIRRYFRMISKKMQEKLNYQINREIFSAYLYLSMASYASAKEFDGFANWFLCQYKEELSHAEKFYHYVNEQGSKVYLEVIEKPEEVFSSILDLFEKTLAHEKKVTGLIHDLVKLAREENDYATEYFLQWFVTEQIEEEAEPEKILHKLKMIGEEDNGIIMMDKTLADRTFTPPATEND